MVLQAGAAWGQCFKMVPDLTETAIFTDLRAFLLAVLPSGVEVIRGQHNRTPEPQAADFVVMTPLSRQRPALNTDLPNNSFTGTARTTPIDLSVQLDVHGPNSADNTTVVEALWRDGYSLVNMTTVSPLYADVHGQQPFENG